MKTATPACYSAEACNCRYQYAYIPKNTGLFSWYWYSSKLWYLLHEVYHYLSNNFYNGTLYNTFWNT